MIDVATFIVYGLASLVSLYAVIFVGPVVARLTLHWCRANLGEKRGDNVIDLNERRRRQLERIADPRSAGRRL